MFAMRLRNWSQSLLCPMRNENSRWMTKKWREEKSIWKKCEMEMKCQPIDTLHRDKNTWKAVIVRRRHRRRQRRRMWKKTNSYIIGKSTHYTRSQTIPGDGDEFLLATSHLFSRTYNVFYASNTHWWQLNHLK